MKQTSRYIKSRGDGLELYVNIIAPDDNKKPKGIIQFVHGMVEHQVYYYDFMALFAEAGYVCVIHDHRGHGRSVKAAEDLGYFYETKADLVVEDVLQITKMMKREYPGLPLHMFSHSMGSLIARKYLKEHDRELSSLVLCGSPSINPLTKPCYRMTQAAKALRGERFRSKKLNDMALSDDKNSRWISIDEKYLAEYNKDPRCKFVFTVNGFLNLAHLMMDTYSTRGWKVKNAQLPILFVAGENDIVIINEKRWRQSIDFLQARGYTNITSRLYPKLKHALFIDAPEELARDVLAFMLKCDYEQRSNTIRPS